MPARVALIAALEREIAPLARSFKRRRDNPGTFAVFEKGDVWLLCAGIGGKHVEVAARWAIASVKPEVVMSVGFAGGLTPNSKVGDLITPATVVDAGTGERFSIGYGSGVLVSNTAVMAEDGKRQLAARYGAQAVDMEAAAVARVAAENGVPFFAVKAISDEVDFGMPPLQRFVDEAGNFRTGKLLAYAAVRPAMWPVLIRLGGNAKLASSQLCRWLENQISRDFQDILEGACRRTRS